MLMFFAFCFLLALAMYFIGKFLGQWKWQGVCVCVCVCVSFSFLFIILSSRAPSCIELEELELRLL